MKKKAKDKILAAKVLVEQTRGAKALSHREKKVVVRALAGSRKVDDETIELPEATETLARPHVREVLVEALATIGVTPETLAKCLAEGLHADDTKFFAHEGVVTDHRDVKDWNARHKYLETALSVVGVKADKNGGSAPPTNVFIFRSHLGAKPVDTTVGAPTDAIVSRRLNAAKVRNRSHA